MIKVRKNDPTKLKLIKAKSGVPPEQLTHARVIRKTNDRGKFQYKLIYPDGRTTEFRNFKDVRYFVNLNLRHLSVFLEIEKEGGSISRVNFSTFQNEGRNNANCVC